MCEFVSWIEHDNTILFLTGQQVFHTDKGKALRDYCGYPADVRGHGAIRHFYGLLPQQGVDHECTDFSSPNNFPKEIRQAITSGSMRGMGISKELLNAQAWDRYETAVSPARAEYEKTMTLAWSKYDKIKNQAWAKYEEIKNQARAEHDKVVTSAWDKHNKVVNSADDECKKARNSAWAKYDKVENQIFWDLFASVDNRAEAWR